MPRPTRAFKRVLIPLLLVAAVLHLTASEDARAATSVGNNVWSGAIDRGPAGTSHVSGQITVPRVDTRCGTHSNVAIWVGLGGYGTVPFAQNGITVTPSGVSAWYELFDRSGSGPVVVVSLPIRAGDVLTLGLAFSSNHTTLAFTWNNLTRHQKASRTITKAARWYNGSTAEWIIERAAFDPAHDSPYLAHFSPIAFTNARYGTPTAGRNARPSTYTSTMNSISVNGSTHSLIRVSTATSTSAFTATWRACH